MDINDELFYVHEGILLHADAHGCELPAGDMKPMYKAIDGEDEDAEPLAGTVKFCADGSYSYNVDNIVW